MNLMDMFNAAFDSEFRVTVPKKTRASNNKPWLSRQTKTTNLYRNVLTGNKMTTAQIASALGVAHMAALQYLYALEKRDLVRRVGIKPRDETQGPGRGQVIWAWNEEE